MCTQSIRKAHVALYELKLNDGTSISKCSIQNKTASSTMIKKSMTPKTWSLWMACWNVGTDDFPGCSELAGSVDDIWDTEELVVTADAMVLLNERRCLRVKGLAFNLVIIKERWGLWGLRIEVTRGIARIAILLIAQEKKQRNWVKKEGICI